MQSASKYKSLDPYRMDAEGLFLKVKSNKQTTELFISGAFEVLGRVRSSNGEGWARLIRWKDD
jgi:hypothetical protein